MTRPDQEGLRLFDVGHGKITGQLVSEETDGFVLAWPAFVTIDVRQQEKGLEYVARFEPIAFCGERYKLYKTAVRGESYRYEPTLKQGYASFQEKASTGQYDLRPTMLGLPEASFLSSPADSPSVPTEAGHAG